jgi:hypothetical protein
VLWGNPGLKEINDTSIHSCAPATVAADAGQQAVIYLESDMTGIFRTINVTRGLARTSGSVMQTMSVSARFSAAYFTVLNCTGTSGILSLLEERPTISTSNFYGNLYPVGSTTEGFHVLRCQKWGMAVTDCIF